MQQEAYEILKRAVAEHKELLLGGKIACLGVLKDYGGGEHPEVNLFAEAVEENIPDRLLRSQPVTEDVIKSIAEDFSSKKFHEPEASEFAVAGWADVLGLYSIPHSAISENTTQISRRRQTRRKTSTSVISKKTTQTDTPKRESVKITLKAADLPRATNYVITSFAAQTAQVPITGVTSNAARTVPVPITTPWAERSWFYIFNNSEIGPVPESFLIELIKSQQCINANFHADTLVWSEGMTSWDAAGKRFTGFPTSARKYGGIRRVQYIGFSIALAVVSLLFKDVNFVLIILFGGGLILTSSRLKNSGMNPWFSLLSLVPIVYIYICCRCLFCQEGYSDAKKLDPAGKKAAWIVSVLFLFMILIAIIENSAGNQNVNTY